jgi:hypothetical protein
MATANLPGGAQYTGALFTSFTGFWGLKNQITTATAPLTDVNGNRPIIITSVRANVGGGRQNFGSPTPTVSRVIRFEIGGAVSEFFTVPAVASNANAPLTPYQGISAFFLNPTTTDFVIKNSALNAYIRYQHLPVSSLNIFAINNDNSTALTLQSNRGITGGYTYAYSPSAPRTLGTSSDNPTSTTLTWVAPENTGDTTITGYRIQYSLNSDFSSPFDPIDVENVLSHEVTGVGLSLDRTYYFRVAAKNAVTNAAGSHSAWSNTFIKNSRPNTPTITVSRSGLTYTVSGSSTIGDGSVSNHRFSSRSSTDGGATFSDWSSESTVGSSSYSRTFTSSAATSYQFRVRAVSATGLFGAYVESSTVHTPAVPRIPIADISLSKNVRKVTIDWDTFRTTENTISSYDGAVISSYQIEERYSTDNGATWVTSYTNIGSVTAPTTVLITGDLLIAKTYQFRVRAVSDVGNSAYQESPTIFVSAYGQRRGSSGFLAVENARRFNGTSWEIILMAKRFNGTSWVDLTN